MGVFNIIRFRKIKTDIAIRNAENHNFRRVDVPNASKDKESDNRYYGDSPCFHDKFNYLKDKYQFKIREKGNNASVKAIEFVISASPEFFKGRSRKEISEYFSDNIDILRTHFFKEEGSLVSMAMHYDETTPHIHVIFVPIVKKGENYSLSCRELFGNKQKCVLLQDIVHAELVKKGWEVSRGKSHQKSNYNDIQEFYVKVNNSRDMYNKMSQQNDILSHYILEKGLSDDFKRYIDVKYNNQINSKKSIKNSLT